MEWYNIHAYIAMLLGPELLKADLKNLPQLGALVDKLIKLNDFISKGSGGPHADLVYLLLLEQLPIEGFDKWRTVQKNRHITGLLGSDIHRNVSVDTSMCSGLLQVVCAGALTLVESTFKITIPLAVKNLLLAGGTIQLSDGDRVDSYDRAIRWMENRALVTKIDQLEIQQALKRGRAYGVFTVFGDPRGFSFTANAAGATLQMGDSAKGAMTITVQAPSVPVHQRGAPFTPVDAAAAEMTIASTGGASS